MDKSDIDAELKRIADSSVFSAHISEMWPNSSVFIAGRVKLDQLRDLVVLMERLQSDKHMLAVKGHPKEEFDTLLRRVGAQVPLDDGMYDLSLAFTVQTTGYLLTNANLQRVPEPSPKKCITHYIRELAQEFKDNTGSWPNTVLLGADNYDELRRACPHGSGIAFPGMDELGTQVTLRIVRVRTPNELRVGLV